MAIIWFMKSGEAQSGSPIAEKTLEWCVQNLGLRPDDWIAGLETRNLKIGEKDNPQGAAYNAFRHVIVGIGHEDFSDKNNWRSGYYLLEKDAIQVKSILDER